MRLNKFFTFHILFIYLKNACRAFIFLFLISAGYNSHAELYSQFIEQIKKERDHYYKVFHGQSNLMMSCLNSIDALSSVVILNNAQIDEEKASCNLNSLSQESD